ncbi:hypothetical protein DM02DRAFT_79987 [Periconia macrospinosa]|uniref:Zn(2)-C6 fungal-type domain-containing protein n=1 Tax=Periconia macrospinosa TaxID=97972 RepID=A0A2V1DHC1_9PLEO|nr:hypothetical protein DM02DRAFT_79987 [Periconia macrospinosa]
MNFVDIQPHSFLDYAWTSPDPTASTSASRTPATSKKLHDSHSAKQQQQQQQRKATRKQNRCCDQCRKGKRACDAAILEDALLGNVGGGEGRPLGSLAGESPSVFHYSDVFGTLARCGNCEKTKKSCTFEWLRSQRVLQAKHQQEQEQQQQASPFAPPAKKRRTQRSAPDNQCDPQREQETIAPHVPTEIDGAVPPPEQGSQSIFASLQQGLTSWFKELLPGAYDYDAFLQWEDIIDNTDSSLSGGIAQDGEQSLVRRNPVTMNDPADKSLGKSKLDVSNTEPEKNEDSPGSSSTSALSRSTRKRRRRSTSSNDWSPFTASSNTSISNDRMATVNKVLLTEALLKIYRESFENHLSCWLTEKTCPVNNRDVESSSEEARPDWNYVYHRVFQLDRLPLVKGKALSSHEEKATSKALNLAIFAFASQWVNTNGGTDARFPFGIEECDQRWSTSSSYTPGSSSDGFDRVLQTAVWNQARIALAEVEGIESFRVALALIVFSLTQKPYDVESASGNTQDAFRSRSNTPSHLENEFGEIPESTPSHRDDALVDECQNMLSKLNLLIEGEGPPVYLEKGLRLLHSLRSRMAVAGTISLGKKSSMTSSKSQESSSRVGGTDRATIELLFWLAMMFDTLSAAMHRRPLVVSPEDSEFPFAKEEESGQQSYDEFLFSHRTSACVKWPCSHEMASVLLCSAAPIKVLLFRKVTRLQSLLSRGIQGKKIENGISAALEVYEHWQREYAPYFQGAFGKHDQLPLRLRAWSICLAGHWHLAALLLADLIEVIDDSGLGMASRRRSRQAGNFMAKFRETNCQSLSDMARCACPREGTPSPPFCHIDSMLEEEALLTEPWAVVLIRAFATAGVYLLESTTTGSEDMAPHEDNFRRAEDCISALWYLGRKSRMAQTAAKMLGEVLKQRRRWILEREKRLDSFVAQWADFDQLSAPLDVDCI